MNRIAITAPATLLAALLSAAPAAAVTMNFYTRSETRGVSATPSLAEAMIHPDEQLRGYGYESNGLIAIYGAVDSTSRARPPFFIPSDNIPQLSVSARSADVFFARAGEAPDLAGDGRYLLTTLILANGSGSAGQTPAPNGTPMSSEADYLFNYCIGFVCEEGGRRTINYEGKLTVTDVGIGPGGAFYEEVWVSIGDFTTLSFGASLFAAASSYGLGSSSATVEFDHTLRWGGVTRIRYDSGNGTLVDAPDGFRLSLLSDNTGFDYWNPAGPNSFPNPFNPTVTPGGPTGGVPEPASWALMIAGFGVVGAAARRRRRLHPA